jgi:hypothetical protein
MRQWLSPDSPSTVGQTLPPRWRLLSESTNHLPSSHGFLASTGPPGPGTSRASSPSRHVNANLMYFVAPGVLGKSDFRFDGEIFAKVFRRKIDLPTEP